LLHAHHWLKDPDAPSWPEDEPVAQRAGGDEWYTPPELVRELEPEFGPFELDPCAPSAEIAKAPKFFTKEQDGLLQDWAPARVFLNPPFSRIPDFLLKAKQEARRGSLVVALLPAKTDTGWWHEHVLRAGAEVRYRKGRVRYLRPDGSRPGSPRFASAVVVYRPSAGAEPRQMALEVSGVALARPAGVHGADAGPALSVAAGNDSRRFESCAGSPPAPRRCSLRSDIQRDQPTR